MPDGRIVYASSSTGNQDIWVMNADGSNRVQLTNVPGDDQLPVVTPDGQSIIFISERDGIRSLYRMGADGSAPTSLGAGRVAYRPLVSADGQWVYYSDPQQQNFRIPVAGGKPEPLLGELTAGGRTLPPAFHEPMPSPDGKAVAGHFQDPQMAGERIAVLFLDPSAAEKRFTSMPANARWAPDGRSLIYYSRGNLYRQPMGGGAPVELTKFSGDQVFSFAVSADQKRWAFVRGELVSDVVMISERQER
jgi:Tol biopolymer transport system component